MESLDPKYKQEGWTIPEGYFEQLETNVLNRLKEESSAGKAKVVYWGKIVSIAASVAIVVMITIFSIRSAKDENEISFNDLDSMDIVQFENSVEFDDEEFETYVQDEVIDSLYTEKIQSQYIDNFISKEDLEDLEEEYSILDDEIEI